MHRCLTAHSVETIGWVLNENKTYALSPDYPSSENIEEKEAERTEELSRMLTNTVFWNDTVGHSSHNYLYLIKWANVLTRWGGWSWGHVFTRNF